MHSIGSILESVKVQKQKAGGSSAEALRSGWPHVYEACVECYFERSTFGQIRAIAVIVDKVATVVRACPAGYMLRAVTLFEQSCLERFPQHNLSRSLLDLAAAGEIRYQHMRGRNFERPAAALTKCLLNLVIERPEKICGRRSQS